MNKKWLVIDGERDFAESLVKRLGAEGLESVWAGSAKEGAKLAPTMKPGAIVIDVHLPDGNGFALFTALKKLKELEQAAFVITGKPEDGEVFANHKKLKKHADLYLPKPFGVDALKTVFTAEGSVSPALRATPAPLPAAKPRPTPAAKPKAAVDDLLGELDSLLDTVPDSDVAMMKPEDEAELAELDSILGSSKPVPPTPPQPPVIALPPLPHEAVAGTPVPAEERFEAEAIDVPIPEEFLDEPLLAAEEGAAAPAEDWDTFGDGSEPKSVPDPQNLPQDDVFVTPTATPAEPALDNTALQEEDLILSEEKVDLDDVFDAPELAELPVEAPLAVSAEVATTDDAPVSEDTLEAAEDDARKSRELAERARALAIEAERREGARRDEDRRRREEMGLLSQHFVDLAGEREGFARKLEELQQRLNSAESVSRLKSNEAAELARKVESLNAALSERDKELARVKNRLRESDADERLNREREDFARRQSELEQGIRELEQRHQTEIEGLGRELDKALSELETQRSRLADSDKARELAERQYAQANEQLSTIHQNAERRLIDREESLNRERLDSERRMEERLAELAEQNKALQAALDNAEARARSAENERDGARQELRSALGGVQSERESVMSQNDALRQEIERLEAKNRENEERVLKAYRKIKADAEWRVRAEKALTIAQDIVKQGKE